MNVDAEQLDQFRSYLSFLARVSWDRQLQSKLDPSDLVQQTLLHAHNNLDQFAGESEAEMAGWLRQILANVLADRQRYFRRNKRNIVQERSVEDLLEESSRRLSGLWDLGPSPSQNAEFAERALRVADAMESLPEAQRDALVLHYWQGLTIPEVAEAMERTPGAVGGLVHRGIKKLRELLSDVD